MFRVLVFPPVSNFRRLLIHKLVESTFPTLKTFSVGEETSRRTVVCFKEDYQRPPEVVPSRKRTRTMPSVGIYLPPAARRLEQNFNENVRLSLNNIPSSAAATVSANGSAASAKKSNERRSRPRRPDMAVYVPRGLRPSPSDLVIRSCDRSDGSDSGVDSMVGSPQIARVQTKQKAANIVVASEPPPPNIDISIDMKDSIICASLEQSSSVCESIPGRDECASSLSCLEPETSDPAHPEENEELRIDPCEKECDDSLNSCTIEKEQEPHEVEDEEIIASSDILNDPCKAEAKKLNPEECDWDSMFDDAGECLDPSLLQQVTSAVGQVAIESPKTKYDEFRHRNTDEEFPHVVEVYNFPPEFKTQDLVTIFNDYKNSGFEIKWVDDTHALAIFSSAHVVSEVLSMQHPLVKVRSLTEGSQQSRSKARRCADSLTPFVTRPDTCAALARRLVTGALGVRLPTRRAEQEAERKLLSEAREKKRLAARQREAAWEGTFT